MNWATVVVLTQLVHYSHLLMKLTLSLYMHDKKKKSSHAPMQMESLLYFEDIDVS